MIKGISSLGTQVKNKKENRTTNPKLIKVYLLTHKKDKIRVVTNSIRQVWAWLYGTTPSQHPKKYSTLLYTLQGKRKNDIQGWSIKPFLVKETSLKALGLNNQNVKHWRFTKGDVIAEVINNNKFLGHIYGFNSNGTAKRATTFRSIAKGKSKSTIDGWNVEVVK